MAQQQQQQQYRDPPPYPGHSKQVFSNQPGLRQSFSGSETSTDVSLSSTENLATWQRQEPQGEETQTPLYQPLDDGTYSILARLGMPTSAIGDIKGSNDLASSSAPSPFYSAGSQSYFSYSTHSQSIYATSSSAGREDHVHSCSAGSSRQNLTVPQHHWQSQGLPPPQSTQYSRARSLTPTYHHPHPYVNQNWTPGEEEVSGQAGQTAPMVSYMSPLPPPPQYPGSKAPELDKADFHRSQEALEGKSQLGHSQPDLTAISEGGGNSRMSSQKVGASSQLGSHTASEPVFSVIRSGSSSPRSQERIEEAVDRLTEENRQLREELGLCLKKVSKLQKFELEIQKVQEAYESLVKSSQKRERLQLAIKVKLEDEVKKLQASNQHLTAQLQQQGSSKKQEGEGSSSSSSSGERKSQHEVLDAKLVATQSTLSRLEEEVRKKDCETGRVEKLQKAFSSLQVTSERREEMEKQLRSRLERELESYRSEKRGASSTASAGLPKEDTKSITALKQILNEKETKILQLETEIVRWEQRYVELQAVQQMEESTGPQQAHLAALEKTSAETEKLIDEAKTEKLRHMEELYQSNRRVAELEARVKWLQAQLTEKEAMVKVYQRAPPSLPRSSSVHAICCSPHHSPRPSLIASTAYTRPSAPTTTTGTTTGSYCDFVSIRHVKTGSTSAVETGRKMSLDDTLTNQDSYSRSKSDSEDETRLWQV